MTQLLPPKKEVALALLEKSTVDVYLDPRAKGVVVPPQFRSEPRLILKIGLNMPVPIPDLRLDDESMSCTLSFNRSKFFCVVPWPSVFAMVGDDGRGMVWPDDVPQELAVRVVDESAAPPESESSGAPVSRSPSRGPSRELPGEPPTRSRAREGGRLAAAPPPNETRPELVGERRKKPKKRKEETRPALVAVPRAPGSSGDVEAPRELGREAGRTKDGVSPVAPRPVPTQRKPKRELPPYLRVVK